MSNVIEIEQLYKEYRLGLIGYGTLREDLQSWWAKVRGKEDPNSIVYNENQSRDGKTLDHILALNDINLTVERGERLGIIGPNGAGKTTLLKILARIASPTKGTAKIKGRVASLIAVGTGFHGELTGRENIYLNGSILGLRKFEIDQRYDEIVDFSGVKKFIDTPVKRYSSGMYVRLGFAVAAHLDPDVLIVDEVLAVGDAEFRTKALGKMEAVSEGEEERTILFVSHNMASIKTLCTRVVILDEGKLIYDGDAETAVSKYLSKHIDQVELGKDLKDRSDRLGDGRLKITRIALFDKLGNQIKEPISGDYLKMRFFYTLHGEINHDVFNFFVFIKNEKYDVKIGFHSDEMGVRFNEFKDSGSIDLIIPRLSLRGGEYDLEYIASEYGRNRGGHKDIDTFSKAMHFNVIAGDYWQTGEENRLVHKICSLTEGEIRN